MQSRDIEEGVKLMCSIRLRSMLDPEIYNTKIQTLCLNKIKRLRKFILNYFYHFSFSADKYFLKTLIIRTNSRGYEARRYLFKNLPPPPSSEGGK